MEHMWKNEVDTTYDTVIKLFFGNICKTSFHEKKHENTVVFHTLDVSKELEECNEGCTFRPRWRCRLKSIQFPLEKVGDHHGSTVQNIRNLGNWCFPPHVFTILPMCFPSFSQVLPPAPSRCQTFSAHEIEGKQVGDQVIWHRAAEGCDKPWNHSEALGTTMS